MNDTTWDVIVVGAGPAGSATAGLLAEAGHGVLVLEREAFPRFHIGESLLPLSLPVLDRLGVGADDNFLYKQGAEFVRETTGDQRMFDFAEALPGPPRHAWQVVRAGFDTRLRDRAIALGATVRDARVLRVELEGDGVTVHTRDGELRARFLVDASGQNRLLARKFDTAQPIRTFGETAAFVHFAGLGDAAMETIGPGHEIRIMVVPEGWGWVIPLPGRALSVGLVCRAGEPASRRCGGYIANSALIQRLTEGAAMSEMRLERNFSYRNLRPGGERFACVGDAACFLDPVFSSGVSLALAGAERIAERLDAALREGDEAREDLLKSHYEHMSAGIAVFAGMIDRFYNTRFIEHFIFGPQGGGEVTAQIVSVLAGDVWRSDNPFARLLVEGRRRATALDEGGGRGLH